MCANKWQACVMCLEVVIFFLSVSDAWDTRVLVDDALASASAARVLAAHAAGKTREEVCDIDVSRFVSMKFVFFSFSFWRLLHMKQFSC